MSPLDVFSEPVWQRLTWTLLHFLWQGLAVAAVLVAILWWFRVRQARVRYAVSLVAMLAMVACPLVTFAVMEVGADARAEVGRGTAEVEREAAQRRPTIVGQERDTADEAVVVHQPVELGEEVALHDPQTVDRPVAVQATEPRRSLRHSGYARTVQPYLMLGWIAGVSLLGARLLLAQVGVQWLRRRRCPIPGELASRVAGLAERLGLRSFPRVFTSERIREAIVVGLLRPMVLLPACWLVEMTPEVLEAVIAHELAHIRRWDLWVNLFQRLVETLLFYQPAVWWVSRRVRLEREMCCDELAVGATGERMAYATALSQAARKRAVRTKPMLGAAIGGTEMTLLNRVRYVLGLSPGRERARWWPVGLLALAVPLAIWSASTDVVRPDPGEAQAEEAEPNGSGSASKVTFDTVSVSFSDPMSRQAPEHIEISADGSCVYKIEGVPARGRVKGRPPARQTCGISDKRLQQLEGMLAKTDWLTAPGGELPAPPGMGGGEITLVRKGQTRSIICHDRAPEPYRPLIWFFRGVARQENLLYRLRWESVAERLSVFNEIRSGTEALEGRWGRGYPFYDLDYGRYLPTCREVLRRPENRHPEEVAAAVRLVAFLRVESEFEPIAKLAHHSDSNVRTQVARALTDFGGARAVPVLAEMAPKTEEAVWGLIRLGDIAVPSMVETIQKTGSPGDWLLSERIVRGYMGHWNELPGPVDGRVVAAVRKALAAPPTDSARTVYHKGFLELVESRPVPARGLSCRIDYQTVYSPEPMRFIHGWYTAADGKIVEHGALAAPEPGTKVFELKFEAGIQGGRLVIRATSGLTRGPSGEQPQPVVAEGRIDVPRETQLEVVYQYRLDKAKMTSSPCPFRVSTGYRTLWEGRLVKDGQTLKRIVYVARVAKPDDPAGEFKPPSAPAPTLAEPERPPRQVTIRGMDLTNASELSDHRIRHDLAMAERNHAIKAEGGTVTEQTQTVLIYKSPLKKAPSRQFVVFHDPKQQVFYIEVIFREVGKRLEIVVYGPLRGDPFEKLGLPVPPGGPEARAEERRQPDAEPDEKDAVATLKKRGARVERDATGMVKTVSFSNTRATDADLVHLKGLANLHRLDLHSASEDYAGFNRVNVTGAGLAHLGGLAKLEELNLLGTTDTDAGLAHLKRLSRLKSLDLGYTKVTDAGLAHLGKLTGLESLSLEAAHEITDAGLSHLKGLAKLEHLRLDYTTIGDVGLKHLKPLAGLQSLHLSGTKVTDAGVGYLAEMRALRVLQVRRTQVTSAGLKKLHEALPNAEIFADSGRPMSVPTKQDEPGSGPAAIEGQLSRARTELERVRRELAEQRTLLAKVDSRPIPQLDVEEYINTHPTIRQLAADLAQRLMDRDDPKVETIKKEIAALEAHTEQKIRQKNRSAIEAKIRQLEVQVSALGDQEQLLAKKVQQQQAETAPLSISTIDLELKQSARLAVTLELTALHWRSLESDERSRPLVTSLIEGLQKGQADNSWKVSFFALNPSRPRRAQLDKFEVGALAEIKAGKDDVWHQAPNGETRYVRAIRATEKSCVICHTSMGTGATDAIEEDDILGVASLTFPAAKKNASASREPVPGSNSKDR